MISMSRLWTLAVSLVLVCLDSTALAQAPAATAPAAAPADTYTLTGKEVSLIIDKASGKITSLRAKDQELAQPHPAGGATPFGYLEVQDLSVQAGSNRQANRACKYNPITTDSATADWKVQDAAGQQGVSFVQSYGQIPDAQAVTAAPFRIAHSFADTPQGMRWDVRLRLDEKQDQNRSVVVSFVLPLPFGWKIWAPVDTATYATDGVKPYRFVYGHTDFHGYSTILPLVGIWGAKGGAAIFCPPDVHKPQITFDVYTQDLADPARGVFRAAQDQQVLRISHHMVGLRPGKELHLAVCIAPTQPDWRLAFARYVSNYPQLFEPHPAVRKTEGMYATRSLGRLRESAGGAPTRPAASQTRPAFGGVNDIDGLAGIGVTCLEVHGHFMEYGTYITPAAMQDPQLKWICRPHPGLELSLAYNRQMVDKMIAKGLSPFMYYYNVHADVDTVAKLFASEVMHSELGKPIIQYQGEPALRAMPDTPFGKHLLEQIDLLIQAYPKAPGFFVDNFGIQMIDFAHDDGVTMFHNRPCYDLNRNHQTIFPAAAAKAHKAGKVMMVNKMGTIESAEGVDMVLLEGGGLDQLKAMSFACPFRTMFPLIWEPADRNDPNALEKCLQALLVWGGTPGDGMLRRQMQQPDTLKAYRPLSDALIGKRLVLEADPLTLPAGLEGQIFRIDKAAPHAGDVVVSLVTTGRLWKDGKGTAEQALTVRLEDAEQFKAAAFLAVEKSADKPAACEMQRDGTKLSIKVPALGAAGIMRLSK